MSRLGRRQLDLPVPYPRATMVATSQSVTNSLSVPPIDLPLARPRPDMTEWKTQSSIVAVPVAVICQSSTTPLRVPSRENMLSSVHATPSQDIRSCQRCPFATHRQCTVPNHEPSYGYALRQATYLYIPIHSSDVHAVYAYRERVHDEQWVLCRHQRRRRPDGRSDASDLPGGELHMS